MHTTNHLKSFAYSAMLLLLFTVCLCSASKAQHTLQVNHFRVDELFVYETHGLAPHSKVWYYRSPQGGQLHSEGVANANGTARIEMHQEALPAFSLSEERYVRHAGVQEFWLKDLALSTDEQNITLSWSEKSVAGVAYRLYRSVAGGPEEVVYTAQAKEGSTHTKHAYSEPIRYGASYRLGIYSAEGVMRYSSKSMEWDVASGHQVYPNPCGELLYIGTASANEQSTYELCNIQGACVRKGRLERGQTILSLHGLAAGAYVLRLTMPQYVQAIPVVKN